MPHEAIEVFKSILNHALSMGYFPIKFKHAKIILLPKPNKEPTEPTNYRPISLLEVPGNFFEKIVNTRTRKYQEINNRLPEAQHRFRSTRNTETAIAVAIEKISQSLAEKEQCYVVQRDVAKVFDKVWHEELIYKVIETGLPGILTKLISSILKDRTTSITLKDYVGQTFNIRCGVPKGSSLSLTVYTIYTSDTPPPSEGCTNILYADEITQIITQRNKSKKLMASKIGREIQKNKCL